MRVGAHRAEEGFTIIEVLIATLLMVVGLMATLNLVEGATRTAATSRSREGATNLAREVIEKSRVVAYSRLDSAGVTSTVRALPGMGSTTGTWTVVRRGVTYAVTTAVCSLDDPADGYGDRGATTWCTGTPAAGTADSQPEDAKRVAVTVAWTSGTTRRSATQVTMRTSQGGADAPQVTAIAMTAPAVTDPADPVITSTAVTSASYSVTVGATAASVKVSVDGVDVGNATPNADGVTWTYSLSLSGRGDGSYEIGFRAIDALAVESAVTTMPLTLARSVPAAPSGLIGGLNQTMVSGAPAWVADLDWLPSSERNVIGYRAYRPDGTTLVCPSSAATLSLKSDCVDPSPVAGVYKVAALYRDASGTVRESGRASATVKPSIGRIFYLKPTTPSSTAGCGTGDAFYDAVENYAGAASSTSVPTRNADNILHFCTPTQAAWAFGGGTVKAFFYMSPSACTVTAKIGTSSLFPFMALAAPTTTRTVNASWSEYEYDFNNVPAGTIAAGEQYIIEWNVSSDPSCNATQMAVGGTTLRSRSEFPPDFNPPGAPSGLVGARNADNSVALSWTASPGPSVLYYRIYRDGQNYGSRYDTTGDATATFTDPNRDGGTHTYRVTAVNGNLEESAQIGPVTK